jgi:DNA-binding PadR family transcriptional regulator
MQSCHTTTFEPRMLGWLLMGRGHGPRRGRHGGPPYGFPGFGPPRGPRARRGDVRAALLVLLDEEPRNGYQLMQAIEERSDGLWRPSPGSVYPALQQLEDEGLVRVEEHDTDPTSSGSTGGGKVYALTDAGRAHVEERRDRLGTPWEAVKGDMGEGAWEMVAPMRQIGMALFQLMHSGSEEQQAEAREVLAETRRALYRILAEDAPTE